MIGTTHEGCGGSWRVAPDVAPAEEADANRYAPAAILRCTRCHARAVLEANNRHPRAAAERVPDQTVFD